MGQISNAVERQDQGREDRRQSVAAFINGMGEELQRSLPKHMDGDRIVRIAMTLIRTSDLAVAKGEAKQSLSQCTPQSFAACLMTASALGLEPGINGQAYLIPFRDNKSGTIECTLIVGYQGMVELAYRHPMVKAIRSGVIYTTDPAELSIDGSMECMSKVFRHRLENPMKTEPPIMGYWAAVELRSGGTVFDVMSPDQVKLLRGGKVGPQGKIADPQHWMERKTVLKQVLKGSPRSIEMHWAVVADEQSGTSLHVQQIPAAVEATAGRELEAGQEIDETTGEVIDGPMIPPGSPSTPSSDDPWVQK